MKSIRAQLTLVVLSLLLVLIAVYTMMNLRIVRSTLRAHQIKDVQVIAEALRSGLLAAMKSGHPDLLHTTVRELGRQPSIVRLRLLRPDGTVISSSSPAESTLVATLPAVSDLLIEPEGSYVGSDELLDSVRVASVYTPVLLTRQCRSCHSESAQMKAVIQTFLENRDTEHMAADIQGVLLLSGLSAFVLAGILLWFATGTLITRPAQQLEQSMMKVEAGDLETRAAKGTDEIGRLAGRFNTMVAELQIMHRQIEESHQAELERADRLATVGELAAGVAHEIKNPLAGISGAIEVMIDDLQASDPNREILEQVLVQIKRVDKTLRDLLSFARLGAPQKVYVDLNQAVTNGMSILTRTPAQQRVSIELELVRGLPEVQLDPDQVAQVVLNLLLNAVQAAMPQGRVVLRTYLTGDAGALALEVEDSGAGIGAEQVNDIFRPFFTTKSKGTGLGLAISRRIARAHGGDLRLLEPGHLGGARFVMHIPLSSASASPDIV